MSKMFRLAKQLGRLNLFETRQCLASGVNKGCRSYYKDTGIQNQATTVSGKPSVAKILTSTQNQNPVQAGSKLLSSVTSSSWMIPRRMMSTLEQMHKKGPPKKTRFNKQKTTLEGCPQKKGIVLKVIIKKPKKPNSANRKCVRVKLSNDKHIIAYIPGEGHNLQEHNIVLIEGGRKQDLPGVKHTVVRGKYDCNHVVKKTA